MIYLGMKKLKKPFDIPSNPQLKNYQGEKDRSIVILTGKFTCPTQIVYRYVKAIGTPLDIFCISIQGIKSFVGKKRSLYYCDFKSVVYLSQPK